MDDASSDDDKASVSEEARYVLSRWGNRHILMDGFTYRKDKIYHDVSYWVCSARAKYNCRCRIHVSEDSFEAEYPVVLRKIEFHNHKQKADPLEERFSMEDLQNRDVKKESQSQGGDLRSSPKYDETQDLQIWTGSPGQHGLSPDLVNSARYEVSSLGKKNIVIGGYLYRKQKIVGSKSYWSCSLGKKWNCKSRLHVIESDSGSEKPIILNGMKFHNHPPDFAFVERKFGRKRRSKRFNVVSSRYGTTKKTQRSKTVDQKETKIVEVDGSALSSLNQSSLSGHDMDAVHEVILEHVADHDVIDQVQSEEDQNHDVIPNTQVEVYINDFTDTPKRQQSQGMIDDPLYEKTVLITDATSKIGVALSKTLADAGASVCLLSESYNELWSLREDIEKNGGDAHEFVLNIANHEQYTAVAEAIEERLGPIDVLINNASIACQTNMQDAEVGKWNKMIDVNIRGLTNGVACVLPQMVQCKEGCIVNIISDAGRPPQTGYAVYSGSKFFVEGLSQALHEEVKDKGVKVICVRIKNRNMRSDDVLQRSVAAAELSDSSLDFDCVAQTVLYALTQPRHALLSEFSVEV